MEANLAKAGLQRGEHEAQRPTRRRRGVLDTPTTPPQEAELASEMIAGRPSASASATTHARRAGESAALWDSSPGIVTSRGVAQVVSG